MVFPNDGQDQATAAAGRIHLLQLGQGRDGLRPDGRSDGDRAAAAASSPKGRRSGAVRFAARPLERS